MVLCETDHSQVYINSSRCDSGSLISKSDYWSTCAVVGVGNKLANSSDINSNVNLNTLGHQIDDTRKQIEQGIKSDSTLLIGEIPSEVSRYPPVLVFDYVIAVLRCLFLVTSQYIRLVLLVSILQLLLLF